MSEESVRVAVRVRPFNDREKNRKATVVVDMHGKTTTIRDPANLKAEPKQFAFDHSYWSHDGFTERADGYFEANDGRYADQMTVFNDLGRGVLDNAWNGYNCSLFAYGQTGSGKSYSMVGYGANKGIVPIVCEELFKQIEAKRNTGLEYQVSVSMFEIYCEKIRDLLSSKAPPKGGLKLREHPKKGFYVENLRSAPVNSYKDIEARIDEGTRNRTVAATNMNATSSRAHTIVQISFAQKGKNDAGEHTTKTSLINLVDLAGSERHSETGSEGDRLKEGIVINQSLSTLGRCIKALHEQQSKGKGKGVQVPYRDSALTSLLKNALGGNSKTVMIAALSPADINYEETLSTLRFADRAKSIKTKAVVNESATDRLIRELREENRKLQEMIKGGGGGAASGAATTAEGADELEALREQLEQNRLEMEQAEQNWQQRLSQEAARVQTVGEGRAEQEAKRKKTPHFWNLNEDPALTDMVVYFVKTGTSRVGNNQAQPPADIQLIGLSIHPEHAELKNKDNKKITIRQLADTSILVNGNELSKETELFHNDRVLFGGNHLYVFAHPTDAAKKQKSGRKFEQITYDTAQSEIAESSGIMRRSGSSAKSKEDMILEEELIQTLPQVYRANAMSDELRRDVRFEIVLVAPQARGLASGTTDIMVRVQNRSQDTEFLWDKNKFVHRYYGMQELYQNYIEGYSNWDVAKDRDPFYEAPDAEVPVGSVHVYLQSLAYMVELDEQLAINDFKGVERGQLSAALLPCTPQGKEITGEFVDSPDELVGKNLNFKVKIHSAIGLPRKYSTTFCRYKFFLDDKYSTTLEIAGSNPTYGHEKNFTFKPVTSQLVEYLKDGVLYIEVLGRQSAAGSSRRRSMPAYNQADSADPYKSRAHKAEAAVGRVQRVLDEAVKTGVDDISIAAVRKAIKEDAAIGNGSAAKKRSSSKKRVAGAAPAKSKAGASSKPRKPKDRS